MLREQVWHGRSVERAGMGGRRMLSGTGMGRGSAKGSRYRWKEVFRGTGMGGR